ncbi:MAG TPA: hypothetical protein VN951_07180 [Pyrinomonadaceae bacterium]|nr:hypothetical protein [Pyrinomonadaceae bacterium]
MGEAEKFSERFGFAPRDREITIYRDAPQELRDATLAIAYEAGLSPNRLRELICGALRKRPDTSNNWSDGNVRWENGDLIDNCEWYEVYEIIEKIYHTDEGAFFERENGKGSEYFAAEINKIFRKFGIGWQLLSGQLQIRGAESFEAAVSEAKNVLEASGRDTARREIHQALADLSRIPEPDKTGAVQHAMAALECVARDVTGDAKATLGEIIKRNPDLIPVPLDQVVDKAWGFSSEHARHLREGRQLGMDEAQLVVGLSAVLVTYLSNKSLGSLRDDGR